MALGVSSGSALAACGGGTTAVTTDKADYAATDTATISGSGFDCGAALQVKVTAPDGSFYTGDGTGTPGPDTVTTDANGAFVLSYALSGTTPTSQTSAGVGGYAGQRGAYTVQVTSASGDVVATGTFTDASQLNNPVPASVIVTYNGLDWVWASPCAQNGCTSGILVGKDGFNYATAAQWALRPPPSAFFYGKCASPWFDKSYNHCDWTDATSGYFGSAPTGGLPAGNDGTQPMIGYDDTWLVRAPADTTAPVITKTITGTAGNGGWYTSNVTVTWSVSDPESAVVIDSGCGVQSFTQNTVSTTSSCTAHSAGGHASDSVNVMIDKNAPSVSGSPTTNANGAGWYSGNVAIHWTCSDSLSGLLTGSCPGDGTIASEGRGLTLNSGLVYDNAGNSASANSSPAVNVDLTAPSVTGAITSTPHTVGATTWYADSAHINWSAADPLLADGSPGSGVVSGPAPGSVALGEGFDQQASSAATDAAGNTGTGAVNHVNVDASAPTVSAAITSTPAYTGWYKDSVSVQVTAADPMLSDGHNGSGLFTDPSGSRTFTSTGSFSATAVDNVGHSTTSNTVSYKVDSQAPTVVLDCSKVPATIYKSATVSLPWAASDEAGGSGLATAASGSITLDTSTIGTHTARVAAATAADNVGHQSSASNSCSYSVTYKFSGFLSPLNPDANVWNTGNSGRTYPIKWQLTDANGAFITDAVPATTISVAHISCPNASAVTDAIDYASATGGTALRYDATANQYIYNWASPSTKNTCYRLTVTTPDGQAHTALFQLK